MTKEYNMHIADNPHYEIETSAGGNHRLYFVKGCRNTLLHESRNWDSVVVFMEMHVAQRADSRVVSTAYYNGEGELIK